MSSGEAIADSIDLQRVNNSQFRPLPLIGSYIHYWSLIGCSQDDPIDDDVFSDQAVDLSPVNRPPPTPLLSGNMDLASRRMASLSKISQALLRNSGDQIIININDLINLFSHSRIFGQLKVQWVRLR